MRKSTLKLVFVGDDSVGKTSLLITYSTNQFPNFNPLVFGSYAEMHNVDGTPYTVELWDSACSADYDRLRPLAYPRTDVFIMCFSVVDPDSYENVRTKWSPETAYHNPSIPVLLVGTKSDLRNDSILLDRLHRLNRTPIQFQQGAAMSKDIGGVEYVECSALTRDGVTNVFEKAMGLAAKPPPTRRAVKSSYLGCVVV